MRYPVAFAFALTLTAFTASPASACSDLPNICAQQAQNYREQLDYWATPPWGGDDEEDGGSDGGNYDGGFSYRYSPEEWAEMSKLAEVGAGAQAKMRAEEHEQRMRDDPRYRQFVEGYWLPQQDGADAKDKTCIAHFAQKGQGVLLMGPSRERKEAFLGFYGVQLPPPEKQETISVTLRQTGDPAQTVKVFYTKNPWDKDMGMIFFAVPTIDAAIAGMTDKLRFDVERNNMPIVSLEWYDGLKARDALKSCVAEQRANARG